MIIKVQVCAGSRAAIGAKAGRHHVAKVKSHPCIHFRVTSDHATPHSSNFGICLTMSDPTALSIVGALDCNLPIHVTMLEMSRALGVRSRSESVGLEGALKTRGSRGAAKCHGLLPDNRHGPDDHGLLPGYRLSPDAQRLLLRGSGEVLGRDRGGLAPDVLLRL